MRAADDCGHVRAQKVQYAYRPEQVFAFLNGRIHLPFRRELLFKIVHSLVQDAILQRCMEADSLGAAVVGVPFEKSPPSRFLGSSASSTITAFRDATYLSKQKHRAAMSP